jgi:FAD:protein FMN transferase
MRMNRRTIVGVILAALVAVAGLVAILTGGVTSKSHAASPNSVENRAIALSGPTMGSTWMVRLPHLPAGASAEQVQSAVQAVLDRIEGEMSTYRAESDLSRFNQSRSAEWVPVPDNVARVAAIARAVSVQTGGAFDVTVGPVVNLWGFGPAQPAGGFGTIPSDAAINAARRHVNYRLLESRPVPPALRKSDPMVYVDFSGIAKGYAAELVGQRLEELGVCDYLVAVGGEMRARGRSHLGRPWRVGIETPTPGTRRVLYEVELKDLSLSTSGDYRNYFDKDGRRYCHEIDPATDRPVENPPASVSVAHASGAYADAMATALMVLGPEKGYALAERIGLPALFISREKDHFEAKATAQFRQLILNSTSVSTPENHGHKYMSVPSGGSARAPQ